MDNGIPFLLDGFSSFVKDLVTIGAWVHFWVFNSIPLIYLTVSVPIPYSFYHYCPVTIALRSGTVICPDVLLLLRIVFAILGFFFFCYSKWIWELLFLTPWRIELEFWKLSCSLFSFPKALTTLPGPLPPSCLESSSYRGQELACLIWILQLYPA